MTDSAFTAKFERGDFVIERQFLYGGEFAEQTSKDEYFVDIGSREFSSRRETRI